MLHRKANREGLLGETDMALQTALSGLEVTAYCPINMWAYRANRVLVEIDGKKSQSEWTHPRFFPLPPGKHLVRMALHSFMAGRVTNEAVNSFLSKRMMEATLDLDITDDSVTRLKYSIPATILGMVSNGLNKGRLQITGVVAGSSYTVPMAGAAASTSTGSPPALQTGPAVAMTKCAACGTALVAGAKFCPECGGAAAQPGICPKCGQPCGAAQKFCGNCGEQLAPA